MIPKHRLIIVQFPNLIYVIIHTMNIRTTVHRLTNLLYQTPFPPLSSIRSRLICTNTFNQTSSELHIIRLLRSGDYDRGVQLFCRLPSSSRSNALHEAMILACAQVPDAHAAQAVLNAMPEPTLSAVSHVISAQCREHNIPAAIKVLNQLPKWKLPLDERVLAPVVRAAAREGLPLKELIKNSPRVTPYTGIPFTSSTAFFVEGGGNAEEWLESVTEGTSRTLSRRGNRNMFRHVISAEKSLMDARGDVGKVGKVWEQLIKDKVLSAEVGVLTAAISAFIGSGRKGSTRAVNVLMTWVRHNLFNVKTGEPQKLYTENPSAMALLVTSTTKALAAAARSDPYVALSAYDTLEVMNLPGFGNSLPLTGAYFKVLQHAGLPLTETRERIEKSRENHIQLDEQAFSMALGAILRCEARVVDKLTEGRLWVELMRSTGIPLTIQTYNLLAGQLRYCNNPELVTRHLADMKESGITPTPVTFGLIFSSCVIPGDYCSSARKGAIDVTTWLSVLEAMQEHMDKIRVVHTCNSRLSLARAYAHLGRAEFAMNEFNTYLTQGRSGLFEEPVSSAKIAGAYNQMMFNFAHCRECSSNGPYKAMEIYEQAKAEGIPTSGRMIDSLIIACVRTGQTQRALNFAKEGTLVAEDFRLSISGVKHLLNAMSETTDFGYWESVRELLLSNKEVLSDPELISGVHELVISFARAQRRDLCNELMSVAGIEVSDLDFVLKGREFLRFRKRTVAKGSLNSETSFLSGNLRERKMFDAKFQSNSKQDREGGHARSFHDEPVLPMA